jgi:hypothetical protein
MNTEAVKLAEQSHQSAQEFLELVEQGLGEDLDMAKTTAVEAKQQWKTLDERRTYFKAPSLEACRRIDDAFMPAIKILKKIELLAKDVIQKHSARARAERDAALAAAQSEGDVSTALAISDDLEGFSVRRRARVRVVDRDKVPKEYWILNEALAKEDIQAGMEIPGLELYYEESVAHAPARGR